MFNFYTDRPTAGNSGIGNIVTITNKASGGSIGTAATTVDVANVIRLNQTTASQTVTFPSPTNTTGNPYIVFLNVGSQSVTAPSSTTVAAGKGATFMWDSTAAAWFNVGA